MLDAGCSLLDAGCSLLDAGCSLRDAPTAKRSWPLAVGFSPRIGRKCDLPRSGSGSRVYPIGIAAIPSAASRRTRSGSFRGLRPRLVAVTASRSKQRATSNEQRASSIERRATSNERRATSNERRATSNERRATSNERRATSNERRATSILIRRSSRCGGGCRGPRICARRRWRVRRRNCPAPRSCRAAW